MQKGVCHLTCIPMRLKPSGKSEMVSMLLYGDHYVINEEKDGWAHITTLFDDYSGWIGGKQVNTVNKFEEVVAYTIRSITSTYDRHLSMGSSLTGEDVSQLDPHLYRNKDIKPDRFSILKDAMRMLYVPYLWGGKSAFGIDCSGYAQIVYKINGVNILRDCSQQVKQGKQVDLKDAQPGDLAFFVSNNGSVTHVGIILPDNEIIHAHHMVRVDKLDKKGIYDESRKEYSHDFHSVRTYL